MDWLRDWDWDWLIERLDEIDWCGLRLEIGWLRDWLKIRDGLNERLRLRLKIEDWDCLRDWLKIRYGLNERLKIDWLKIDWLKIDWLKMDWLKMDWEIGIDWDWRWIDWEIEDGWDWRWIDWLKIRYGLFERLEMDWLRDWDWIED